MATVKGKWTFKEILTALPVAQDVNFTSGNNAYVGFFIDNGAFSLSSCSLCYEFVDETLDDGYGGCSVYFYEECYGIVGWDTYIEEAKTIDFGETEQTVSDEFYAWLVENAVQVVENIKIDITESGTTTLATAGKYCDRNIDVNVDVEDRLAALVQGTIEGEYASDEVTSVKDSAFSTCKSLTGVSFPKCTSIGANSFRGCTALESVNLPSCVSFINTVSSGYFFDSANNLKSINIPNLTTIETGTRAFGGCYALEEFNAPNLTSLTSTISMFTICRQLKKVNLPKLGGTTINMRTFENCYVLEKVILGGSQLNPLDNVSAFSNAGTHIENGANIYVPDDLVDTYKTATNWANFADKIKPISELEE